MNNSISNPPSEIIPLVIIFNNKKINKIINSNCKITAEELIQELFSLIDIDPSNTKICNGIFYLLNGKIIPAHFIITDNANPEIVNVLECFPIVKGGFDLENIPLIGQVFLLLKPIINPIIAMGNVFIFLLQMVIWFGKFIYWLIMFLIWAFTDLLNPIKLVTDFWNSIILIIVVMINTIINVSLGLAGYMVNQVGGWMQGFWGWDQSNLTYDDKNSNYFRGIDMKKGKKCYLTNNNKVPFSIILGTIICPPVGVFMDLGITGWVNILICMILTLMYYIPGLVYAFLIIYS